MPAQRTRGLPTRWPSTVKAEPWIRDAARRLGVKPPRASDPMFETLARALVVEDSAAEQLIAWMKREPNGRAQFDAALDYGIDTWADPPPALAAFFASVERRPAWARAEVISLGGATHLRLGLTGSMVTGALGLVAGYRNAAVAKTLVMTQSLTDAARRRIDETSQFAVDVYDSRGMTRSSAGFRAAVRVRLVHAFVRSGIRRSPDWQSALWGSPIAMLDTLGTALQFWVPIVLAARTFGYTLSEEECIALMTTWNYVAYLQGVPEEMLPQTVHEAYRLYCGIWMLSPPPDENSRRLGEAFLRAVGQPGDLEARIRGKLFHGVAARLLPKQHRADVGIGDSIYKFWPWLLRPLVRLREKKRLRDPGFDAVLIARGRQALYESIRVSTRTATTFDPRAIVHNLQLLTGS